MKTLLALLFALPVLAATPKEIVDRTATVLEEGFVDPARAKEIASQLRAKNVTGEGRALADAITDAIHTIENDGHLNVRFDPAHASDPLLSNAEIRTQLTSSSPLQRRQAPAGPPKGIGEPKMLDGNVGYLKLDAFPPPMVAAETIDAAMEKIKNADSVIIDLRDNHGGAQPMVDYLASYFLPVDHPPLLVSRFRNLPEPLIAQVVDVPTRALEDAKLYILISDNTFSAGEAFATTALRV